MIQRQAAVRRLCRLWAGGLPRAPCFFLPNLQAIICYQGSQRRLYPRRKNRRDVSEADLSV
jgi:hypothetical protein